jgi:predicted transcriptional regulator of viral defense system
MRLVDAHARLLAMERPAFETSDAAAVLRIPNAHASTLLARLARAGHLVRLRRGVWAFPDRIERFSLPEYVTAPFPSYVSVQSALYHHGMIGQIPAVVYAASLARTCRRETPLGVVSVHHVAPGFFFGFEPTGRSGFKMATPEKALLDVLYLSPAKSGLFAAMPELELDRGFKVRTARRMISRIASTRRRSLVARRFETLMGSRGTDLRSKGR